MNATPRIHLQTQCCPKWNGMPEDRLQLPNEREYQRTWSVWQTLSESTGKMEHPEAKCTSQNPLPKSDTNQTPQRFAPLHSKVKTMNIYEILNTLNILMVGQAGRPLLRFCRPRLRMNIIQPCPSPMATSPYYYQRIALYTYKEIVFTLLQLWSGT